MPTLRQVQSEWNALVPAARAAGIRRVNILNPNNPPREAIAERIAKLAWLRSQLGSFSSLDSLTFGVEIECFPPAGVSRSRLADILNSEIDGMRCQSEGYNHSTTTHWKIVSDASVGTSGAEIVSPVLQGEAGMEMVRKVCAVLSAHRCRISKSCGLHVHVGVRGSNVDFFKDLVQLYCSAEDAIDSFVAPSRRVNENQYCRSLKGQLLSQAQLERASNVDEVAVVIKQGPDHIGRRRTSGRYCKLNLQPFWQHGTVEFRHHQGTVDPEKTVNWVRFCLRMVMAARAGRKTATTIEELMAAVEATEAERNYFNQRVDFFRRATQRRAA